MTTTTAVLTALARHLADLGLVRYQDTGAYTPTGLPAVVFGGLSDTPRAAVALASYNDDDTRQDAQTRDLYVQIRVRAGTTDVRNTHDLGDNICAALHRAQQQTWPGGIRLLQAVRVVAAPAEPDDANRWTRPDSYRLTINPSGA